MKRESAHSDVHRRNIHSTAPYVHAALIRQECVTSAVTIQVQATNILARH